MGLKADANSEVRRGKDARMRGNSVSRLVSRLVSQHEFQGTGGAFSLMGLSGEKLEERSGLRRIVWRRKTVFGLLSRRVDDVSEILSKIPAWRVDFSN